MCSVVGYVGHNSCRDFILEGLRRLEYRGYDSAGFSCIVQKDGTLECIKSPGHLKNLSDSVRATTVDGFVGIGHTRWATHGKATQENAHPHFDCHKSISVVHNGIIENFAYHKKQLLDQGHTFFSETDTEIIAHLLHETLQESESVSHALKSLLSKIRGTYAFVALSKNIPDALLLARKGSPLCVGIGDDEMFVSSDVFAFAGKADKVLFLPDESYAIVTKDTIELYDAAGSSLPIDIQDIAIEWNDQDTAGYEHHMIREIYEQKQSICKTVDNLQSMGKFVWDRVGLLPEQVSQLKRIVLIGCGTSWHAGSIAKYFFADLCNISTCVYLASEFRYRKFFPDKNALYIVISQSGETADTLEVLRLLNKNNCQTMALTNCATSTMVREADGFLVTQAGHEVSVASTKAFSTQVTALYWFAHAIMQLKNNNDIEELETVQSDLQRVAHVLQSTIDRYKDDIGNRLAAHYAQSDKAIFLGRHISFPLAQEAALKLQEIAYVFALSYSSGELKHGPLALVDETVSIFIFSHPDELIYQKLLSNAQEVRARGGIITSFVFEGQEELANLSYETFVIPCTTPYLGVLSMTGLMQFLIYHIAKARGCPIDKPRNLAKSVTVE